MNSMSGLLKRVGRMRVEGVSGPESSTPNGGHAVVTFGEGCGWQAGRRAGSKWWLCARQAKEVVVVLKWRSSILRICEE